MRTYTPPLLELYVIFTVDSRTLLDDIQTAIRLNPTYSRFLNTEKGLDHNHWLREKGRLILYENQIFVPDSNNLQLCILKSKHNHKFMGYLEQSKTYQLVQRYYSWPNLKKFVTDYIRSCNTCSRNKTRRHKSYRLLK